MADPAPTLGHLISLPHRVTGVGPWDLLVCRFGRKECREAEKFRAGPSPRPNGRCRCRPAQGRGEGVTRLRPPGSDAVPRRHRRRTAGTVRPPAHGRQCRRRPGGGRPPDLSGRRVQGRCHAGTGAERPGQAQARGQRRIGAEGPGSPDPGRRTAAEIRRRCHLRVRDVHRGQGFQNQASVGFDAVRRCRPRHHGQAGRAERRQQSGAARADTRPTRTHARPARTYTRPAWATPSHPDPTPSHPLLARSTRRSRTCSTASGCSIRSCSTPSGTR